jgi:hypothetical protein
MSLVDPGRNFISRDCTLHDLLESLEITQSQMSRLIVGQCGNLSRFVLGYNLGVQRGCGYADSVMKPHETLKIGGRIFIEATTG